MATAIHVDTRQISTLDLLKVVAVVLMLADHVGLYFYDSAWLRIAGRPVAVIFGFLIGYSGSSRVPPSWVGLGLGLSLLSRWLFPEQEEHTLDILLALALTRITIPFFEKLHGFQPLLLVPAVGILGLLTEPVNEFIEYGTEVPIMALLGVALRLDQGRAIDTAARHATALSALIAISLEAIRHFELTGVQALACVAVLAITIHVLSSFRKAPVTIPEMFGPMMRWIGRNTLMIYAVHLALFQLVLWYMLLLAQQVDASDEDEDEEKKS